MTPALFALFLVGAAFGLPIGLCVLLMLVAGTPDDRARFFRSDK